MVVSVNPKLVKKEVLSQSLSVKDKGLEENGQTNSEETSRDKDTKSESSIPTVYHENIKKEEVNNETATLKNDKMDLELKDKAVEKMGKLNSEVTSSDKVTKLESSITTEIKKMEMDEDDGIINDAYSDWTVDNELVIPKGLIEKKRRSKDYK